jgi:tetratricopeptide (TPR) repeat protein
MRAEHLHQQLILPEIFGGRGMSYSALSVNTGIEAFAERQANCLSYTLLYVGLARHIGLDAQFNEVILPPTWSMRDDDTYLFLRHVNAKVIVRKALWGGWVRDAATADIGDVVVDLEMRRYRPNYRQYPISDKVMASQFYSNRGLELAAAGDAAQGFLHLRKALLLNERLSYIWSNLASVYRRQGYWAEAEALYLEGLRKNHKDLTVMHNLAGLYRERGNNRRAGEFEALVRSHRNANPYYIYRAAQAKRATGDLAGAAQAIEKALKKQRDEPLFYEFAIAIYEALGEPKKAQKLRAKLEQITITSIR